MGHLHPGTPRSKTQRRQSVLLLLMWLCPKKGVNHGYSQWLLQGKDGKPLMDMDATNFGRTQVKFLDFAALWHLDDFGADPWPGDLQVFQVWDRSGRGLRCQHSAWSCCSSFSQASDIPEPLPLAQIFGYLLVAAVCHAQFHLSVQCWIKDQCDVYIYIW
jgi:hypothetical protein